MSIICAICKRKQSGWIQDYPLSNDNLNLRICTKCFEQLSAIRNNKDTNVVNDAKSYFEAYLATDISPEAKRVIQDTFTEYDNMIEAAMLAKEEERKAAEEAIRLRREQEEEQERQRVIGEERIRKEREAQYHIRLGKLKEVGFEGYYEYKAVSIIDEVGLFNSNSGRVDVHAMTDMLNEFGLDGWRLVTAYSNELGKNALSGGVGGAVLGINSTIDESILIFERFIKI